MLETASRRSIPHLTSAPCWPGTESIVKFSEIFCWAAAAQERARVGPVGSTSATTAKRVKAYNKTGPVERKKNLVPKLDPP